VLHHSQHIDTAKKGRGLSSLLISKVGREARGRPARSDVPSRKKRKLNDGEAEEEEVKESESEEEGEELNDEMAGEVSQNQQQYVNRRIPPVPKLSSKYGSRKKRPFGQFQQEQSSAKNELSDIESLQNLHTPKTVRNSAQKFRKTNAGIQEVSPDKNEFE
jgi:hypothetical protein